MNVITNINEISTGNLDKYTEYAREWILDKWDEFKRAEKRRPEINGAVVYPQYTTVTIGEDEDEPVIGIAKCSETDEFNTVVGVAIAYARAIGEEVPDEVIHWNDYEDDDDYDTLTVADLDGGDKVIIDNMVYIACEMNPITREVTMYNLSTNEREYLDGDTEVDRILD
jgi:hypothetical protein